MVIVTSCMAELPLPSLTVMEKMAVIVSPSLRKLIVLSETSYCQLMVPLLALSEGAEIEKAFVMAFCLS